MRSFADPVWSLLLTVICWAVSLPFLGWQLPAWIQPSFVGLLWGGQFMLGFWLAGARLNSPIGLVVAGLSWCWLAFGFHTVTDFTIPESLLFGTLTSTAGWLVIRWDRGVALQRWPAHRPWQPRQIPIIDFVVLTAIVACLLSGARQLQSPPALLIGVGWCLLIGCSCCWMAYEWAWNDRKPVGPPLVVNVLLIGSSLYWLQWVAPSLSMTEIFQWLVSGPASVLAAQVFTVLVALAAARRFARTPPAALSNCCDIS